MIRRIKLFALTLLLVFNAYPCGWDWDTMQMEKEQFPSIHELITGKFLRHSQEFYYWRVKDRTEKLVLYPDSLELYDDLGWAYDKIGDHENAIHVFLEKEALSPGLYETYANLGTCYLHDGQLETGLEYIKKAIAINPEAHFGREVYQQYLVEYIISKSDSTGVFPVPVGTSSDNFYHFLTNNHFEQAIANGSTSEQEMAKAIKGIAGMMRFGNYNSPILLEAVGDLLYNTHSGETGGAGHLASRAYLMASFESNDETTAKAYKQMAEDALELRRDHRGEVDGETVISIRSLDIIFKLEVQAANTWFDEVRQNELAWIEAGINPDSAFAATYYDAPELDEVGVYGYKRRKDEIDEEYWLNYQLYDPTVISAIHNIHELSDSTKQWLDSIYDQEFSFLPDVVEDTSGIAASTPAMNTEDDGPPMGIFVGLALSVLAIIIALTARARKKRKGDS